MSPAELVALVAALGTLAVSIGTAVAAIVTAMRVGKVQNAVNGHTETIRELATAQGFTRGVEAVRSAAAISIAPPVGPAGTMGEAGKPPAT